MITAAYDAFIAAAPADAAAAMALRAALLRRRCRVYLPAACLIPGDPWDETLPAAQRASRLTVVLISAALRDDYFAHEQIAIAIERGRRQGPHRLVPIYLRGDALPAVVPFGLRRLTPLFAEPLGGMDGVAEVLTAALGLGDRRPPRPAPGWLALAAGAGATVGFALGATPARWATAQEASAPVVRDAGVRDVEPLSSPAAPSAPAQTNDHRIEAR